MPHHDEIINPFIELNNFNVTWVNLAFDFKGLTVYVDSLHSTYLVSQFMMSYDDSTYLVNEIMTYDV